MTITTAVIEGRRQIIDCENETRKELPGGMLDYVEGFITDYYEEDAITEMPETVALEDAVKSYFDDYCMPPDKCVHKLLSIFQRRLTK